MAPALLGFSFASPIEKPKAKAKNVNDLSIVAVEGDEIGELRLKNKRLLQQLEESRKQEAELRAELEETRIRLHQAREAEERLCTQLGELEAESVEQARAYHQKITSLTQRLKHVEHLLSVSNGEIQRRR
uniref:Uncharacterized protein n=1 Tax=Picea sitchensis TaxID=3332 RepID=A9NNC5_PICSI|nr:unknown [Picea sitchensis]ABK24318.1 unknown [Picea sitchensis]